MSASTTSEPSAAATAKATEQSTQKRLLLLRDAKLRERFSELYHRKRQRHDDVIKQLETEFFITERTIRGILKTSGPDLPPAAPGEQTRMFS